MGAKLCSVCLFVFFVCLLACLFVGWFFRLFVCLLILFLCLHFHFQIPKDQLNLSWNALKCILQLSLKGVLHTCSAGGRCEILIDLGVLCPFLFIFFLQVSISNCLWGGQSRRSFKNSRNL